MKLIGWLILLLIFGYIAYKCQSSLFSDYSKNYDEEHDAILAQKIADEVIRRLDEREKRLKDFTQTNGPRAFALGPPVCVKGEFFRNC